MRILGIDPGSIITGWGVVEKNQTTWRHVDCGIIAPSAKLSEQQKLVFIFAEVQDLVERFHPETCAVENVFYAKNIKSTLKLGQARGAALVAAALKGVKIASYLPTEVKKAVSGYGQATKDQIQMMIKTLLKLPEMTTTDASDALAVALCHAHSIQWHRLVGAQL